MGDLDPLAPYMLDFYRTFAGFPEVKDDSVEQQLWWQLLSVEDRPTAVLSHRSFGKGDTYAVLAARHRIGRGMIVSEVSDLFELIRKRIG